MNCKHELSIIIPTLNEEFSLGRLMASLALQTDVELEVIVADGGSCDSTLTVAGNSGLRISALSCGRGRATQLNAGAAAACGEHILFLHADSEFCDCLALRNALTALRSASPDNSGRLSAGHFAIRFGSSSRAYHLLERKARLNRKGCSHGDQGILIPAGLFREYGGFDESCQILAETRFADSLRANGQWLLLPAELLTSRRRFEAEGLKERQTLNAVIMALGAVGRDDMIDISALYADKETGSKLQLQPVFRKIADRIASLNEVEQTEFWRKTGEYICENAWQVAFRTDLLLQGRNSAAANEEKYRLLGLFDRYLARLADNSLAVRLTASACRLWLKQKARN